MDKTIPTITIGCPIRNREKYLPHYLECVKRLDYPKNNITLLFILNDSTDDSKKILYDFKKDNQHLYHKIKIETYNLDAPLDNREHEVRQKFIYTNLSKLRNYFFANCKTDYALSCDSDIMMPFDTLQKLLKHNKDYVAGLICNGYEFRPSSPHDFTNILQRKGKGYIHIIQYPENNLISVDFSGAIFLISKKAYKKGKFAYHYQGEDGAFCESLISQGFRLFCDTGAKCYHIMNEKMLQQYIDKKLIW